MAKETAKKENINKAKKENTKKESINKTKNKTRKYQQ